MVAIFFCRQKDVLLLIAWWMSSEVLFLGVLSMVGHTIV